MSKHGQDYFLSYFFLSNVKQLDLGIRNKIPRSVYMFKHYSYLSGAVVSTSTGSVTSQQKGSGFKPASQLESFCVKFACSVSVNGCRLSVLALR